MPMPNSVTQPTDESTVALFDASPAALAARFGQRTLELIRQGRACGSAAMIAVHFARIAAPDPSDQSQDFGDRLFSLGVALNREHRDRLMDQRTSGSIH